MSKQNLNGIHIGLGEIWYSKLEADGYSIPKSLGEAITFNITPTENSVSLWAGDREIAIDTGITATGTLGVPSISNENMCDLFGFEMGTKGELIYKSNAQKPTIALFVEQHNRNGVTDYISIWECKLQLNAKSGNTKTESITHGTTEVAFNVIMPKDKIWMSVQSSDEDDFEAPNFETKPVKPVKKVVGASVLKSSKA